MAGHETRGDTTTKTKHAVGTREEWTAARNELAEREAELTDLSRELAEQRRALPWVAVEKEYAFDTDAGPRTLAELFDGRSQLLIYNIMFGPSYTGACPGCSGLADHFDAGLVHLNHRDVTMVCVSRAPLEKIQAYKRRMGWRFPWVSSFGSDYGFDFGFAATEEQQRTGELAQMIAEPPEFLKEWVVAVGTDLASGLAEGPGWIVFALRDGVVYHTFSRHAPDGALLAPYYYQLLDQTPRGRGEEFRAVRHDEYEDA
jgi:predicted dithiol-disulfide oxidoreductase (DUF899 family)